MNRLFTSAGCSKVRVGCFVLLLFAFLAAPGSDLFAQSSETSVEAPKTELPKSEEPAPEKEPIKEDSEVTTMAEGGAAAELPGVAGRVAGMAKVESSGAASYSVPVIVPPGTAGIAPKLAFTYNSQGDNGLLGVGWSLSGLPTMHRCPRTVAQDGFKGGINYDFNDRFCLDGQRLMVISGAYGASGSDIARRLTAF